MSKTVLISGDQCRLLYKVDIGRPVADEEKGVRHRALVSGRNRVMTLVAKVYQQGTIDPRKAWPKP